MVTSQVLTFLEQPAVVLITGLVIRANTGGDKTKMATRAGQIADITIALQQINAGNTAQGLTALQQALAASALDPSEALAIQETIAFFTQLTSFAKGTLLGQLNTTIFNNITNAILQTCALYPVPVASVTPAPTPASPVPAPAPTAST